MPKQKSNAIVIEMAKTNGRGPGHAIQVYLKKYGVSQKDFADDLGVSQSLVSQWISGRARPTPETSRDIIKVTGGKVARKDLYPELFSARAA